MGEAKRTRRILALAATDGVALQALPWLLSVAAAAPFAAPAKPARAHRQE